MVRRLSGVKIALLTSQWGQTRAASSMAYFAQRSAE
jgi:hypothetical protein